MVNIVASSLKSFMLEYLVMIGFFLLMSSPGFYVCIKAYLNRNKLGDWAHAKAIVREFDFKLKDSVKGPPLYDISIKYDYDWEGQTWSGSTVALKDSPQDKDGYSDILMRGLKVGVWVMAWVDTKQPSNVALLDPRGNIWINGMGGGLFWIFLIGFFSSMFLIVGYDESDQILSQIKILK
jgi:hypothetical protein